MLLYKAVVLKKGPGAQKGDSAALKTLQMIQNKLKQQRKGHIVFFCEESGKPEAKMRKSVIFKRHSIIIIYNLCIITAPFFEM